MELCNYMIVAYKVLKARVSAPEHYCSTRLSSDKCYEKTKILVDFAHFHDVHVFQIVAKIRDFQIPYRNTLEGILHL